MLEKVKMTDTKDGITIRLYDVKYTDRGIHAAAPDLSITNETGTDVMQVFYELSFYDRDGNELASNLMFYTAETPLKDGDTVHLSDRSTVLQFSETPFRYEIRCHSYKSKEEMPVIHIPKTGEYVYEALNSEYLNHIDEYDPIKVTAHIDQMGYGREAGFTEEKEIREITEAFLNIRIASDDAPMITDNYNWVSFEWGDGTAYTVCFNLKALEYEVYGKYYSYELKDDDAFWELIYDNLKEME